MRTIIAGSRDITDITKVYKAISNITWSITEVVSGGARGVDKLGEYWAICEDIPIKLFLPNWGKFGKKSGFIRNVEMALYAEALVAVWDGVSKGTGHMIDTARAKGLKIHVELV